MDVLFLSESHRIDAEGQAPSVGERVPVSATDERLGTESVRDRGQVEPATPPVPGPQVDA
jgi:hypothetical protein